MFGNRNKTAPIDSLIGAGTVIEGDLCFIGGLRIDGRVQGKVTGHPEKGGTLVISEQGCVVGEIRARRVLVNGTVDGPVYAAEAVELLPKARVSGDVRYQRIEVHLGAQVTGRLIHDIPGEVAKVVELPAPAQAQPDFSQPPYVQANLGQPNLGEAS